MNKVMISLANKIDKAVSLTELSIIKYSIKHARITSNQKRALGFLLNRAITRLISVLVNDVKPAKTSFLTSLSKFFAKAAKLI